MASASYDEKPVSGPLSLSHWSNQFVGLPWRPGGRTPLGLDCYGLAWLVYRSIGIDLPAYTEIGPAERVEIAAAIIRDSSGSPWREVMIGDDQEYDIPVFRMMSHISHVGVVAGAGLMLHIPKGQDSSITSYRDGRWRDRLVGIYRHAELA